LVDLVGVLGPFGLGMSGIVAEVDEWIEQALAVEDVEPRQRLDVLLLAAWYLDVESERVVETASEALRLADDLGDDAAQMFALGCLAAPTGAIDVDAHLQRALSLAGDAGHPAYVGWAAQVYLNVLFRRHDVAGAAKLLDEIFAFGSEQYGFLEGNLLYQRARQSRMIGDLSTAEDDCADAMTAALRTGSPVALSYAHFGQGQLARARGDLDQARRAFEHALDIDARIDRPDEIHDRMHLARICVAQGDVAAHTNTSGRWRRRSNDRRTG
jgi:tetratricopeptide (TPR) repeat protein